MNKLYLIFCLALVCTLFVSCDFPDYTDEINAAYFNAGGSAGNAECTYGKYRCSNGNSQFCAYSGNDLSWQLSETCSYGCDSSTGKCNTNSGGDSGDSGDSGNNSNPGNDTGDSGNNQNNDPTDTGTEEPTPSACYPNPCENLANSTGICTTTHDDYVCGCKEGYNWRHKECVQIPKALGNICTGQTKCYTDSDLINCNSSSIGDFYGQDAYYAARGTCIPQKFRIDNSVPNEKTVIDENTGLEWQQNLSTNDYGYVWEQAIEYCEELEYGGHNDWRLPTVKELFSIVDRRTSPAINTTYFDTPVSSVWSSSKDVRDNNYAWITSFYYGNAVSSSDCYRNCFFDAGCVRGKNLTQKPSFTSSMINGDEIITDSETGLIWQKTYDETEKKWSDALAYCENLTYAGYSDWRMPNINELLSLVNYEEYDPASDFSDMPSKEFWSSSTYVNNTASIWLVNFSDGSTDDRNKIVNLYVRCVR